MAGDTEVSMDVIGRGTSVACPLCGETIEFEVSFLEPGPDTGGKWAVEVDDGSLRQHMERAHG